MAFLIFLAFFASDWTKKRQAQKKAASAARSCEENNFSAAARRFWLSASAILEASSAFCRSRRNSEAACCHAMWAHSTKCLSLLAIVRKASALLRSLVLRRCFSCVAASHHPLKQALTIWFVDIPSFLSASVTDRRLAATMPSHERTHSPSNMSLLFAIPRKALEVFCSFMCLRLRASATSRPHAVTAPEMSCSTALANCRSRACMALCR
mmetsp:Transcript_145127/g.362003  ORF Transcript_145127/g.362003 Transcript_145127/m.362003 type:complete len:210 (+) Transcript_145127:2144-2773(+)